MPESSTQHSTRTSSQPKRLCLVVGGARLHNRVFYELYRDSQHNGSFAWVCYCFSTCCSQLDMLLSVCHCLSRAKRQHHPFPRTFVVFSFPSTFRHFSQDFHHGSWEVTNDCILRDTTVMHSATTQCSVLHDVQYFL